MRQNGGLAGGGRCAWPSRIGADRTAAAKRHMTAPHMMERRRPTCSRRRDFHWMSPPCVPVVGVSIGIKQGGGGIMAVSPAAAAGRCGATAPRPPAGQRSSRRSGPRQGRGPGLPARSSSSRHARAGRRSRRGTWRTGLAVGETVILLHPPLPLVGVSIGVERGCQQNDSLADGWTGRGRKTT